MKTHRTCGECRSSKPWEQNELLCIKFGVHIRKDDCCNAFVPKQITLEAAWNRLALTGNRHHLQECLRLRREML